MNPFANYVNLFVGRDTSSLSDLGLIFCRRQFCRGSSRKSRRRILLRLHMAAAGRFLDTPAAVRAQRWESAQPRLSAYILLMFQAMVTRLHSPRTRSSPRSRNWRNLITDLMIPNTGSGVCLRKP